MQTSKSSKNLILGIEGGGTKTEWILAEGRNSSPSRPGGTAATVSQPHLVEESSIEEPIILQRGLLGTGNFRLVPEPALEAMFLSLPRDPASVGVFLAGCATADDRDRLGNLLFHVWPEARIAWGSDRESGFAAAFGERDGIAVIAGTGSAVTGRCGGRVEKAGGWGQLLGDEGSGYGLAMKALRLALCTFDLEQRVDSLAHAILAQLGLENLEQLVAWAIGTDKMAVARLAPLVFEASRAGNLEMSAAIQAGAKALVEYTAAVAKRLVMDSPEVQVLGGLFMTYPEYFDLFRDYLSDVLPGARVEMCTRSGALGAVWLAQKQGEERVGGTHLGVGPTPDRPQAGGYNTGFDQLPVESMVDLFIHEEAVVANALQSARPELCRAIETVTCSLKEGGRLFYVGAGTSGRLGVLDASEIPPTFGTGPEMVQAIIAGGDAAVFRAAEGAEDDAQAGGRMLLERGITSRDVVCGIAASGRTPFVLGALEKAKEVGAATIFLTCNPERARERGWDVEIDLPTGPEIIAGSTRLKAGTATKVALNVLSTCTMARLGRVSGNLMIDLRATNSKLKERAVGMVCQLRGCLPEQARRLLEENGWEVRKCLSIG